MLLLLASFYLVDSAFSQSEVILVTPGYCNNGILKCKYAIRMCIVKPALIVYICCGIISKNPRVLLEGLNFFKKKFCVCLPHPHSLSPPTSPPAKLDVTVDEVPPKPKVQFSPSHLIVGVTTIIIIMVLIGFSDRG